MRTDNPLLTAHDLDSTRQALEFLVEAVAREIRPGVLDLRPVARTLREALEDPSPDTLTMASQVFNAMDPALRHRIRQSALSAAEVYRTGRSEPVIVAPRAPAPASRDGMGSLLHAVNFGLSAKPAARR